MTAINSSRVRLYPRMPCDALSDYRWRKDKELSALNGEPPFHGTFTDYLNIINSTDNSIYSHTQRYFSIKTCTGQHIGTCAIYDIDWQNATASVGISIGDRQYWNKGYGTDAFMALIKHAFHNFDLQQLQLKTLKHNMRAQACFAKCGFLRCGSLMENNNIYVLMKLNILDYGNTESSDMHPAK
jgi:RimJ/RimL family protein N-acetyltransferase